MKDLAATPPGAEELKARKSVLVGAYGRNLATTGGLADILGTYAIYGIPLDEITRYTAKVDAVTPAEVQAFAGKVLNPADASVIVAGDAKTFDAALKARLPNLVTIPVTQLDLGSPTLTK